MPKVGELVNKVQFNAGKSAIVAEFLGTFLYTLTIPLSTITNNEVSPIAIGSMLMSVAFTFGYLSGGHFNPAVTIGVYLTGIQPGLTLARAVLYILSQLIAAFAAVWYNVAIHGPEFPAPEPSFGLDIVKVFFTELFFTFTMVSAVAHVMCSKQRDTMAYGFAVGMPMVSGLLCVGGIVGGAFNPASVTALLLARCMTLYCYPLLRLWLYWVGEIVGALLAVILFKATSDASGPTPPIAVS